MHSLDYGWLVGQKHDGISISDPKKKKLLPGVYAERYHTYSLHKQSRALAGVRNPSLAWWFVTVLLCYWVVNLKEKIPLCFHLLCLEKGPPLLSLLLSWFITTCNPEACGEGWLRAGISAPLLNTSVSYGFTYGKMEGETWPLPAARLTFLRYLWEKMEPTSLRKEARISAGIFSLVEIRRGGKNGWLWATFGLKFSYPVQKKPAIGRHGPEIINKTICRPYVGTDGRFASVLD